ncbi:glycosyltransferase family 2 protein [Microbulbifer bruguierae]|uniref:Glycosyltransferase family 2 protein n=1 Tax=Microbulbifer bruguierae TaxID=3029061 RepID=A0ABY8NH22_9GAMM|nr:glycosyltransferase family 2 protein [Microbulbifer bruguierae]WGL18226.1 glycosyltransferase family 2 protein [Microbulbifer bruguierae]
MTIRKYTDGGTRTPDHGSVRLNIVIVCYNCGAEIARLLADIVDGDLPLEAIEFFVVDNASGDDSRTLLRGLRLPRITLIESPRNLGFAAGCNLGARDIGNSAPILFLNPDVRLQHDSLTGLLGFAADNTHCGIWGGITCNVRGELDGKSAWREPSLLDLLCWSLGVDALLGKVLGRTSGGYSLRAIRKNSDVDAVSGCFLLIEQKLFRALDGFDEDFFLYSEEIDLCRRARLLGARPRITDRALIQHAGSQTLSGLNKLNHLYRSKLRYFRKHGGAFPAAVARWLIAFGTGLRMFAFSVLAMVNRRFAGRRELWRQFFTSQRQWTH